MPHDEILRYMLESWRNGGCTCMAWERYLDYLNVIALLGHKSGSHLETYIDATGIGLSLPAVMVLADYKDTYKTPSPPMFKSVTGIYHVTTDLKTYIAQKMFPSTLTDF